MGGEPGDPSAEHFRLQVHGEVENPFTIDFASLLAMPQTEIAVDVHCVTGWTVLGAKVKGVRVKDLADKAKPTKKARHVIFEAAHGYTSNVRIARGAGAERAGRARARRPTLPAPTAARRAPSCPICTSGRAPNG